MIQTVDSLRLLDNVAIPDALRVKVTQDSDEFMSLRATLNSVNPMMWGTAYRQGGRLHFATAMAVRDYVRIARVDQAAKGSTLDQAREHTNRPKEPAHAKAIGQYLSETACEGQPFIFPSFILNYGLDYTDDQPQAELLIFSGNSEALAWPAIFTPPVSGNLPVTDGGHRTDEIDRKLRSQASGRLAENAISVLFVFEQDRDMYHQDFADCAKAKAISNSLQGTWDRRDVGRKFGIDLVEGNPYLRKFVDATSNSVNLSTNSSKCWSMSAVQSAISSIYHSETNPARFSTYIDLCFQKLPILVDIAMGVATTASIRTQPGRGGCVLLRGVGFAVLTQAYSYALAADIELPAMADYLATIDWHVIKPDAPPQREGEYAAAYVEHAAQPIWINMLAMLANDTKFRIKGTRDAAEVSFKAIRAQLGI